jgi:Ca-activated chloride channel family protein
MERFFEDLFAEAHEDDAAPNAAARPRLFAALRKSSNPYATLAALDRKLAAYLDGKLGPEESEAFLQALAGAPDEIYELESAQAFLDAVSAQKEAAPADLVAQAIGSATEDMPARASRKPRSWNSAAWGRQWGWAGGAIAAAVLATVISKRLGENEAVQSPPAHSPPQVAAVEPPSGLQAIPPVSSSTAPAAAAPSGKQASAAPTAPSQQQIASVPLPPPSAEILASPAPTPAAAPAREQIIVVGSLIRGAAAVGVPVTNLDSTAAIANASLPPAPPPPPPAAPSVVAQAAPPVAKTDAPENVLITGSLVRGSAAVGVPVTNLSPQDFRTSQIPTADLFRSVPPASSSSPAVQAPVITGSLIPGGSAVVGALQDYRYARTLAQPAYVPPPNTERYPNAPPNAFKVVRDEPVSTFSADVDTSSYANVRRFLNGGSLPPTDAVRVEEMINYFDYAYATPKDRSAPFEPTIAVYPSPWNKDTQILHVGIKGFDLPQDQRPRANLVFLIDTSGSMAEPNKLPLLKRSFRLLVDRLQPEDRVAIVVYAGTVGIALPPTPGTEREKILAVIDSLNANGSTAGGEGIRQAYELAKANFDREGVNRILLATDGDFNVGITDPRQLEDFVARERSTGIFLSVLGFGVGNYNDLMMQKLAQAGNGVANYIDTDNEAQKVFVQQLGGTLFTIAKDVKFQVEFNPARVAEYRLIGYETRLLNRNDFNNDKVDAGDIGSGHTVTALYEITPVGSPAQTADPLRYGAAPVAQNPTENELAYLKIRYKLPNEDDSRLISRAVTPRDVQPDFARLSSDIRFASAVAGGAQLLRHDSYLKSFDYERAIGIAENATGADPFGYRREFIQLLQRAERSDPVASLTQRNAGIGAGGPAFVRNSAAAVRVENKALADAVNEMNNLEKARNFAGALAKAKEVDAIPGKPAQLNRDIHNKILALAIAAKDYASALAQIDRMIAANEGNKNELLGQALAISLQSNNKEAQAKYQQALGTNIPATTRLFIADGMRKAKQYKEALVEIEPLLHVDKPTEDTLRFAAAVYYEMGDPVGRRNIIEQLVRFYGKPGDRQALLQLENRVPSSASEVRTPPVAVSSHEVTVADYPPISIRLQEQGTVSIKYSVEPDGRVGDCAVETSSGKPRLDSAACLIAQRWLFKPATGLAGTPLETWLESEIQFVLK